MMTSKMLKGAWQKPLRVLETPRTRDVPLTTKLTLVANRHQLEPYASVPASISPPSAPDVLTWHLRALQIFKRRIIDDIVDHVVQVLTSMEITRPPFKAAMRRNAVRHFDNAFIRWMFRANISGNLEDVVPKDRTVIVRFDDIEYFLAREIPLERRAEPVPTYSLDNYHRYLTELRAQVAQTLSSSASSVAPVRIQLHKDFYSVNNRHVLSQRQFLRLQQLHAHADHKDAFHRDVWALLERYHFFGGLNSHLSTPPDLYTASNWQQSDDEKPCRIVELFGTPLNTSQTLYCSPFAFEVKTWSSQGSFFNFECDEDGLYLANPPFDAVVMEQMSRRLIDQLNKYKTRKRLTVVVTLPVWDDQSQKELQQQDYGLPFAAFSLLKECPFYRQHFTMLRQHCKYYDFFADRLLAVSNTHLILLSNHDELDTQCLTRVRDAWVQLSA